MISSETYSLLRYVLASAKPATKRIEDMIGDLQKIHLNPAPILIPESYKFYDRQQKREN